jgi:hypothetical protein
MSLNRKVTVPVGGSGMRGPPLGARIAATAPSYQIHSTWGRGIVRASGVSPARYTGPLVDEEGDEDMAAPQPSWGEVYGAA